jgi:hypothetical protein
LGKSVVKAFFLGRYGWSAEAVCWVWLQHRESFVKKVYVCVLELFLPLFEAASVFTCFPFISLNHFFTTKYARSVQES